MAFQKIQDLDCETTIQLGGTNKETRKPNAKSAEGYYLGSRKIVTKYGDGWVHVLQTQKGNLGIWGKSHMDRKLLTVPLGTMVRITHTGQIPTNKGNDMITYDVELDPSNTIRVTAVSDDTTEAAGTSDEEYVADDGETDELEEEEDVDVVAPARAKAPAVPTRTASAESQQRVKDLLKGAGKRAS